MKVRISMKTPDCVYDAARDALFIVAGEQPVTIDREAWVNKHLPEVEELMEKWFRYGEYAVLECDIEFGTCKVLEV